MGNKVFLRSSGSAKDEPTVRGAYPWWHASVIADSLTWKRGNGNVAVGSSTVLAADLQPGEQTVTYRGVVNFDNVTFDSSRVVKGGGTVVVDDAQVDRDCSSGTMRVPAQPFSGA